MYEIITPAPYFATRDLFQRHAGIKPIMQMITALQLARARTYAISFDGKLLAVVGFWPLEHGEAEVFTVGAAPEVLRPHLRQVVRLGRLIVAEAAHSGITGMSAHVRVGHRPGQKLARLAGFGLSGMDPGGGFERWENTHELIRAGHRQPLRRE